jgi:hypothetical protein
MLLTTSKPYVVWLPPRLLRTDEFDAHLPQLAGMRFAQCYLAHHGVTRSPGTAGPNLHADSRGAGACVIEVTVQIVL